MRISDWSSDVCSSDLPCHLSEFLASREWLTEKKAWPRHPLLSQKCIPLKKLLRYPLALCDPVACEGHARQVDRVLRCVNNRVAEAARKRFYGNGKVLYTPPEEPPKF